MKRVDLIAFERFVAATYQREAKSRRSRYPALADQLDAWAAASLARAERMRIGPLFGAKE